MNVRRGQSGFSLIELAVVLVIIGLLVGGGIAALDTTQTQARRSEQQRTLAHVREALYGFAMSEGRLPCPDDPAAPDGLEDASGSPATCDRGRGVLPWADLGVGRRDAWGFPHYYAVTDDPFAREVAAGVQSAFTLSDTGNLSVEDDHDSSTAVMLADEIPAVVLSFGPQGGQVWTAGGFVCPGEGGAPSNGFSDNESENCDNNDNRYVDAGFSRAESGERFDDQLIWLPGPVLKARMVSAGRLP